MTVAVAASAASHDITHQITTQLWDAIAPDFLATVDWSADRKVLTFPHEHPLLGWRPCLVPKCDQKVPTASGLCAACFLRWKRADRPDINDFLLVERVRDRRLTPGRCAVTGCQRLWNSATTRLCPGHDRIRRRRNMPVEQFLSQPALVGYEALGSCAVAACTRDRNSRRNPYYNPHSIRWRQFLRRNDTAEYDEERWRRTQSAIAVGDEVSLRGLPERVVAEMLFGLQQQVAAGIQVEVSFFRRLGDHMRSQEVQSLTEQPWMASRSRYAPSVGIS